MITAVTANFMRLGNIRPLWTLRRGPCVSILNGAAPDVILVQECPEDYERYILDNLTGPWSSSSDHVNTGVMVRSDRFRRLDARPFTLRGGDRNRYASGAILESLADGTQTAVVSAHPSANKETDAALWRRRQAAQLLGELSSWGVADLPVVLGGDWNESAPAPAVGVAQVLAAGGYADARAVLPPEKFEGRDWKTSTGFAITPKAGLPIDRFFVNRLIRPTAAKVLLTGAAADHLFVSATFAHLVGGNDSAAPVRETAEIRALLKERPLPAVSLKWVNRRLADGLLSRHIYYVQVWLRSQGLYRGVLDGYGGPATRGGLDGFRRAKQLRPAVGPLTSTQLKALKAAHERTVGRPTLPVKP